MHHFGWFGITSSLGAGVWSAQNYLISAGIPMCFALFTDSVTWPSDRQPRPQSALWPRFLTGTTAVILHSVEPGRGKGCEVKGRSVVSAGRTSTVYQYDPQRGNTWATMPFAASTRDVFNRVPVYVRHPKKQCKCNRHLLLHIHWLSIFIANMARQALKKRKNSWLFKCHQFQSFF